MTVRISRPPLVVWYPGGKWRLASTILSRLPPHTCYVEPFCGASSVLFAKERPKTQYTEVLNDADEQVVTFLRVLRDDGERLRRVLSETAFSRSEFLQARRIVRGEQDADDFLRAWAFFVAHQQGYAGAMTAFAASPPSAECQRCVVTDCRRKTPWLTWFQSRLLGVSLEKDDAISVIRRYDHPATLFYCDPPYVGAGQQYTLGFTDEQLAALCQTLQTCQGSFVLSHPRHPAIPDEWPCVELSRSRPMAQTKRGGQKPTFKECVFVVDRSEAVKEPLASLLFRPSPTPVRVPIPEEDNKNLPRLLDSEDAMD